MKCHITHFHYRSPSKGLLDKEESHLFHIIILEVGTPFYSFMSVVIETSHRQYQRTLTRGVEVHEMVVFASAWKRSTIPFFIYLTLFFHSHSTKISPQLKQKYYYEFDDAIFLYVKLSIPSLQTNSNFVNCIWPTCELVFIDKSLRILAFLIKIKI